MVKHKPIFQTRFIEEFYTKKDRVTIKYVCTTALDEGTTAADIFYRDTPHPEFGNRYFKLYNHPVYGILIGKADKVEELEFGLVEDEDGNLHYSQHRWDCLSFSNGSMIDGGRAYTRSSGKVYLYRVKDGEMVKYE